MYFSFYFEKCTFIDIKLKDLFGALVFGKHGLSLTNPLVQDSLHVSFSLQAIIAFALAHPTATRSTCCAIDLRPVCLSQVKPKLRKKVYNSKLFVSRCTPFIIYFSQNHSSASFFSCFKQRGDYLTSSKIIITEYQ